MATQCHIAPMEKQIKLQTIAVSSAPPLQVCLSCDTEHSGNFCAHCGQDHKDMRRSIWVLLADIFGGVFSFESKMWRTWTNLVFKPGKVSRSYAFGARTKYSSPIRTYLVMSLIFFGFMSFSKTNFISFEILPKSAPFTENVTDEISPSIQDAVPIIDKEKVQNSEATKPENLKGEPSKAVPLDAKPQTLSDLYKFRVVPFSRDEDIYKLSEKDMTKLADVLKGEDIISTETTSLSVQDVITLITTNPKVFNNAFNTWLPRLMFCMVPFAALLGWVFIHGKNVLLYDHLIHALYLHTVFFLFVFVAGGLASLTSNIVIVNIIFRCLIVALFVYFIVSIKTTFRRGWFKTIFTSIMGGGIYVFLLMMALTGIGIYSIMQLMSL